MSKLVLLLDDNLMTTARIRSQMEKVGYRVKIARCLPEKIDDELELVIINLGSRTLQGNALIQTVMQQFPKSRVIGFCGHAEVQIRQQAKQAGLSRILTNDEALQDLAKSLGVHAVHEVSENVVSKSSDAS